MSKASSQLERAHQSNDSLGERRWTRLSKDADNYVRENSTEENPPAAVIRELCDYALRMQRLQSAGKDPAIRELLSTFDHIVNSRVQEAVAGLSAQTNQLALFIATLFLTQIANLEFPVQAGSTEQEETLYEACGDHANQMLTLVLNARTHVADDGTETSTSKP